MVYKKRKNLQCKAAGICVTCMHEKAIPGYVQCEKCRVKKSEKLHHLITIGICINCQSEYAEPGKQQCYDCAEKNRLKAQVRYAAETEEQRTERLLKRRVIFKLRTEKMKAAGLCTRCGKRKVALLNHNSTRCLDCILTTNRRNVARKPDTLLRSERPSYGLCYICGSTAIDGKKLCARCRDTSLANLAKSRQENSNHPSKR